MLKVNQLAKMAGVSPRTLRYYDAIDLLKPSAVGENGYRLYTEEAVLRLQQIMFYRAFGLPLETIREVMSRPDFDVLTALAEHRAQLRERITRMQRQLVTIDQTMQYLQGGIKMKEAQFFAGFDHETQAQYQQEAEQKYDPAVMRASAQKWQNYTAAEKQRIADEGNAIYSDLYQAMPHGADSAEVQACVARWHAHMQYFWSPNDEQLLGLADLYNADERFRANFDKLDPTLAAFMRQAVQVYVQRRQA